MKKKLEGFIKPVVIIETLLLLIFVGYFLYINQPPRIEKNWKYEETFYISENDLGYIPENGFIDSAKTAKEVGSAYINSMTGKTAPVSVSVYYNSEYHLWAVSQFYLGHPGGVVYLDQFSGEVIRFWYYK